MEKNKNILTMFLLAANLLNQHSAAASSVFQINGLETMAAIVSENELPIDGIIIEAWLPLENIMFKKAFLKQMNLTKWQEKVQLSSATSLKLSQQSHGAVVQIISADLVEAVDYYHKLNQFTKLWAKNAPVGATMICSVEENLTNEACRYLLEDLLQTLPERLISATEDGAILSYSYYVEGVTPVLKVAEERVNLNIAFHCFETRTMIYIGSPVIFQQY